MVEKSATQLVKRRPCENTTKVSAAECKDQDGNWTKWILARLDKKQSEAYMKLLVLIRDDKQSEELKLGDLTENHLLRYLNCSSFNPGKALKKIIKSEKEMIEMKMWDVEGPY
jgi:hypothetical protein